MAQRDWTIPQGNFIGAKSGPILVSAAAGSGKTAAIVERVTRRLSDRENPLSADRLLMTTFSIAAAGEMQDRISASLEDMLAASPEDDFIASQIDKMQSATICTIHSLCFKIIRENFSHLGLTCDFRVADEPEAELIMRTALEKVTARAYEREDIKLNSLIEMVCGFKSDRELSEIILKLYKAVIAMPFPDDTLAEWLSYHEGSDEAYDKWMELIAKRCKLNLDYAVKLASENLSIAADCEKYDIVKQDADIVTLICEQFKNKQYNEAYLTAETLSIKNNSVPKVKDKLELGRLKSNRTGIKDSIDQIKEWLCYSDKDCFMQDQKILYPNVKLLFELLSEFIDEFAKLKREKNLLDFADAEHFALSLLWKKNESGEYAITEFAQNVSDRFDEIYIDEYQDVNAAQEMIFKAIAPKSNSVFMVGDVKQSIYGFRHADSDIFDEKRNNFYEYDGKNFPATIFFDRNFRSREGVVNFVNQVFYKIMKKETCGSDYTKKEALDYGASYLANPQSGTEFVFYQNQKGLSGQVEEEADLIASEIKRLLESGYMVQDGKTLRPCEPRDFCILARSSTRFPAYLEAMTKRGINARITKKKEEFVETREMRLILSVLKTINNPYDEISLAAAMMSPVFVFTPEQIAAIKADNKYIPLFDAVKSFAENGDSKCVEFLKTLRSLQGLSASLSADEFIAVLYEKYGIYNMVGAMPCGDERMDNLDMFRHYARQFEKNGYKGLNEFIRFVDRLSKNDQKLKGAGTTTENRNSVSVMTIHASKGLEFPICLLANPSNTFNHTDTSSNTLIDKQLGFSCVIKDDKRTVQYSPLSCIALRINAELKQIAEEMRILYVALTRAREKLIVPIVKSDIKNFLKDCYYTAVEDNPIFQILSTKNFTKWLMLSSAGAQGMQGPIRSCGLDLPAVCEGSDFTARIETDIYEDQQTTEIDRVASNPQLIAKIKEAAEFSYPYKAQSSIPSKFSVSELLKNDKQEAFDFETKPDFMHEQAMSGAERGTALHTFMQFADFERASKDVEAEIEEVYAQGHISKRQKDAIEISRLKTFFNSDLLKRILAADTVLREYKFMTGIDSKEFGGDVFAGDKVILQGIADCVIIKNGQAILIDYKTDFVKAESELVDRYGMQLAIYKGAIEKLLGLPVKECLIYSFCLGKEIPVTTKQNII